MKDPSMRELMDDNVRQRDQVRAVVDSDAIARQIEVDQRVMETWMYRQVNAARCFDCAWRDLLSISFMQAIERAGLHRDETGHATYLDPVWVPVKRKAQP